MVQLDPGLYLLEVWGAGSGTSTGGFTSGILKLDNNVDAFVNIGENGMSNTVNACGGGGSPNGGGSTHISLGENSLYSRVIVAGGSPMTYAGNIYGGGLVGGTHGGEGGQQDRAGSGCITDGKCNPGKFFFGANSTVYAGGGGWFGGASHNSNVYTGGGGSGYGFTKNSYKPDGFLLDQQYYLSNVVFDSGGKNYPFPYETNGNGFALITKLKYTARCQEIRVRYQGLVFHLLNFEN